MVARSDHQQGPTVYRFDADRPEPRRPSSAGDREDVQDGSRALQSASQGVDGQIRHVTTLSLICRTVFTAATAVQRDVQQPSCVVLTDLRAMLGTDNDVVLCVHYCLTTVSYTHVFVYSESVQVACLCSY